MLGQRFFFSRNSIESPNEIWKLTLLDRDSMYNDQHHPDPVTQMNAGLLSTIDMQPLEGFSFKGANNDVVQGFILKPPGFDPKKKYPLKFLIHGGPQGAWGNSWTYRWNAELFAATGNYVVVMINFHGSTGYGQKFTDSISGDWGGKPYVDLMKGLDYVEKTYPFIDKNREAALGASYGGYMANWLLGHTNRFKCIVSHDGTFNAETAYGTTEEFWFMNWEFGGPPWKKRDVYRKWSPHEYAQNFKTPTLVVHGQNDYRLDVIARLRSLHDAASAEGSVEDVVFPGRRPLGAQAAEQAVVVQNRERLGGSLVRREMKHPVILSEAKDLTVFADHASFIG